MPNDDLGNAFAALSDDTTRQARLAPAAAVRRRADRQAVTRSLTGVAAAVLLVAGIVVGSRLALTDNALPPLPPAESIAPTPVPPSPDPTQSVPSPPPSTPPSSSDAGSQGGSPATRTAGPPVVPKSVPDRAFLRGQDTNGGKLQRLSTENRVPITFCGAAPDYDSEDDVAVRGAAEILYQDGREDYTPLSAVDQMITVYRGDGAERFLDEFRAMVKKCPANALTTHRSLGSAGLGDESVLVRSSSPATGDDGEPSGDGTTTEAYHAVVRVGDTVLAVSNTGYESQSVEREAAEALFGRAVQRLTDWRS
jgi:hypothetical protein